MTVQEAIDLLGQVPNKRIPLRVEIDGEEYTPLFLDTDTDHDGKPYARLVCPLAEDDE